jgi:hypothetical protein
MLSEYDFLDWIRLTLDRYFGKQRFCVCSNYPLAYKEQRGIRCPFADESDLWQEQCDGLLNQFRNELFRRKIFQVFSLSELHSDHVTVCSSSTASE